MYRHALAAVLVLAAGLVAHGVYLDDTFRNDGLTAKGAQEAHSPFYQALSATSGSTLKQQKLFLEIYQTLEAPSRTNPLMLPPCLEAAQITDSLTAAISSVYASQITEGSVVIDTTYIQNLNICTYSSFIAYQGSESVRTALVEAAEGYTLCDVLESYCTSLNIQVASLVKRIKFAGQLSTQQKASLSSIPMQDSGSSTTDGSSGSESTDDSSSDYDDSVDGADGSAAPDGGGGGSGSSSNSPPNSSDSVQNGTSIGGDAGSSDPIAPGPANNGSSSESDTGSSSGGSNGGSSPDNSGSNMPAGDGVNRDDNANSPPDGGDSSSNTDVGNGSTGSGRKVGMIRRRFQNRFTTKDTDVYIMLASSGTANPDMPPVIEYNCKKFTFTQLLDHFASDSSSGGSSRGSAEPNPVDPMRDADPMRGDLPPEEEDYVMVAANLQQLRRQPPRAVHGGGGFKPRKVAGGSPGSGAKPKQSQPTFQQVYWVCDSAWPNTKKWQKRQGNVIVFLGNEAPLDIPKQPIVFENARRLNALVILVEHRYYGESLPFPDPEDGPLPTDKYKWLTMSQVIADTVSVVQSVRKEWDVPTEVPAIVIGGSYGGMLSAYHRVVRPDVFASAVTASGPIHYIFDTKMWDKTSNRYHQFIEDSANVMSGNEQCSDTIRAGLAQLLKVGKTAKGRESIRSTFHLCGDAATVLPNYEAVEWFQLDIIGTYQGIAQVNNQPPLMNEMHLACEVLCNSTDLGRSAMDALAAVETYIYGITAENCYDWAFNPLDIFVENVTTGYNSFSYQSCTEGLPVSFMLPAKGSDETLNPQDIPAPPRMVDENCRAIFGPTVSDMNPPDFALDIRRLLDQVGGVVFTNGDIDGWAGGSVGVKPDVEAGAYSSSTRKMGHSSSVGSSSSSSSSSGQSQPSGATASSNTSGSATVADKPLASTTDASSGSSSSSTTADKATTEHLEAKKQDDGSYGASQHHSDDDNHLAFVVYHKASHCTDTHTENWNNPEEPPEYKQQRALAMDYAVKYAEDFRVAVREKERQQQQQQPDDYEVM